MVATVQGYTATRLHGYKTTRLHSYTATRLRSYKANKLKKHTRAFVKQEQSMHPGSMGDSKQTLHEV